MNNNGIDYDPASLKRELNKFYIAITKDEEKEMLSDLSLNSINDLYSNIPSNFLFDKDPEISESITYNKLIDYLSELSMKNNVYTSFLGHGLKDYKTHEIVPYVSKIRGLTTAYTPYQPEVGQGTLHTLWIYSSLLSKLTGFEAINASLYDRSTCLYEGLKTALRLRPSRNKVLVCETIYSTDIKVIKTLAKHTELEIVIVPQSITTGKTNHADLREILEKNLDEFAAIAFPQVNSYGNLEDVDDFTDIAEEYNIISIAMIDPILIATDGLTPPSHYGKNQNGTDIIVAEGQHLAIAPNFGGPGLGVLGIRYNQKQKNNIRSTAGRFVGKTVDSNNKNVFTMVLSTREQHIRREKATSNICSNQSFIATLVGASILARGEDGMRSSCKKGNQDLLYILNNILKLEGINLAFPSTPFYNEVTIKIEKDVSALIEEARNSEIHLGVNISNKIDPQSNRYLLLSCFDRHSQKDLDKLISFFQAQFKQSNKFQEVIIPDIPKHFLRKEPVKLPDFPLDKIKTFYTNLGKQNLSPDDNLYPLGSCTMKYNPYINEYAANLPGFINLHPEVPIADAQGSLEILYNIQEMFKKITGLPGVTTQPLAGAQGELVGLKMFQAFHKQKGEQRDIIIIPRTAHGTNPATATMAGFQTKKINNEQVGIITLNSDIKGKIDIEHLKNIVSKYKHRVSGIMVTNPNTSGIFESDFKEVADIIHSIGGLVYMDGANMNAIAGYLNLKNLGVDAVHNNLHKTWSIPHGGGGPGDAIVAVSDKLINFLPGVQIEYQDNKYYTVEPKYSIGSFHRHFGNFAHKVRCFTYLKALGSDGVKSMSATAVLSSTYLLEKIKNIFPILPENTNDVPRMHEFIITLSSDMFKRIEETGLKKSLIIPRVGKLFLDFGIHAPTVAFPEIYGLMIEPTESFSKKELDNFINIIKSIKTIIMDHPEVLHTAPHFSPVGKVDELSANKNLKLSEEITELPEIENKSIDKKLAPSDIICKILDAHKKATQ